MFYLETILFFACIYVVLALSLNISMGLGRVFSLWHAGCYGAGAYAASLVLKALVGRPTSTVGTGTFVVAIVAAGAVGMLASLVLSSLAARLRDDYLLLSSLGLGIVFQDVLTNARWSGGSLGLHSIPALSLARNVGVEDGLVLVASALAVIAFAVCTRLERSDFGTALLAVGQDETLAITSGESPFWLRARALAVGGVLAGAAGALVSTFFGYIDPTFFGIDEAMLIFTMVVVGGMGSSVGVALGAIVLTVLPNLLVFVPLDSGIQAHSRQIIYGLALIVVMRVRPAGLYPLRAL